MLRGDCSSHLLLMLLGANVETVVGLILPDIACAHGPMTALAPVRRQIISAPGTATKPLCSTTAGRRILL